MKKLIIILAILLPFASEAQRVAHYDSNGNVTYLRQDTIKIPYSVAKSIAKDLVICDSTKAILEVTKEQLTLVEQKSIWQDSVIANHERKGIMYEDRIKNEQLKFNTQGLFVKHLQKQNKKLKVKLVFTKITLSAVIGGLTYLYFTK